MSLVKALRNIRLSINVVIIIIYVCTFYCQWNINQSIHKPINNFIVQVSNNYLRLWRLNIITPSQ